MYYVASKVVLARGRDSLALCDAVNRVFRPDNTKAINMEWKTTKQNEDVNSKQRYDTLKL